MDYLLRREAENARNGLTNTLNFGFNPAEYIADLIARVEMLEARELRRDEVEAWAEHEAAARREANPHGPVRRALELCGLSGEAINAEIANREAGK